MTVIAEALNGFFDVLTAPFGGSAAWAVLVMSALVGVLMLLLYKWSTDQEAIVAARRVLTGRIYEMGLYQDHLGVLMKIQRDLIVANLRYLRRSLPALAVIVLPMVLILVQMEGRFGHRPLRPGETTLLEATVAADRTDLLDTIALSADGGVTVETPPVRDYAAGTAVWRLRADTAGRHAVAVRFAGAPAVTKEIVVGGGLPRLAEVREHESLGRVLLNPAEAPLPTGSPVARIDVDMPSRRLDYAGIETDWLIALIVFSLATGLAVKDLLRVRF